MKRHCIHKLKEGKTLNELTEIYSKYVIVEEFAKNPLDNSKKLMCVYKYIDIDTLEYTDQIMGYDMLPCGVFDEYFDLYMETSEINHKLNQLCKD